ncbi:hypothetical protein CapIbe_017552 [Capra ibex]
MPEGLKGRSKRGQVDLTVKGLPAGDDPKSLGKSWIWTTRAIVGHVEEDSGKEKIKELSRSSVLLRNAEALENGLC